MIPKIFAFIAVAALALGPLALHAAQYQPLFSKEMLEQADPATRARLQALDERNHERWLAEQRTTTPARSPAGGGVRISSPPDQGQDQSRKLYRYKDAEGNIRFTDQYVAGAKEVSVAVRKPSAASRAEHEARQQEQAQLLEYYDERDAQKREAQEAQKNQSEKRARREQQCKQLLLDIHDNRRGGFVSYDIGANGERIFLSDAELAARTDEMEAKYRKRCGQLPANGR